ncbi:MAG: hypothetical protein KBD01_01275 [Acidobacteria bacterium]|nr:hypothetical protein [Acidobacteriota bacterium]
MSATSSGVGDLVLVADVHVGADDPELDAFRAFLAARAGDTAVLALLGDIFALWVGDPKFTLAHHRAVLDACAALRAQGVRVLFVEGNREFLARRWRGVAFDDVAEGIAVESWAGRRWCLAHGDLLDRGDRRGRLFRSVVRSRPFLGAFRRLPARTGLRVGDSIERALRHRNLAHKTAIPAGHFERYAAWLARRGFDGGVIGHVHVEMDLRLAGPDGRERSLYVLPDWRSTRRHLRIPREGPPRFESFGPPAAPRAAVIGVAGRGARVELTLDRAAGLAPGDRVELHSGHGPQRRGGRVVSAAGRRVVLDLAAGPPVQVGDRVVTEEDH